MHWNASTRSRSPCECVCFSAGYPVLAGQITESSDGSKQAIAQYTDGLPIPSAGPDGLCDLNYVSNVRFGADALTSCRWAAH
jgi:hypothetical protein